MAKSIPKPDSIALKEIYSSRYNLATTSILMCGTSLDITQYSGYTGIDRSKVRAKIYSPYWSTYAISYGSRSNVNIKDLTPNDTIWLLDGLLNGLMQHLKNSIQRRASDVRNVTRQGLILRENQRERKTDTRFKEICNRTLYEHMYYFFPPFDKLVNRAKELKVWDTVSERWKLIEGQHHRARGTNGGQSAEKEKEKAGRSPKRPPKPRSRRGSTKRNNKKA